MHYDLYECLESHLEFIRAYLDSASDQPDSRHLVAVHKRLAESTSYWMSQIIEARLDVIYGDHVIASLEREYAV